MTKFPEKVVYILFWIAIGINNLLGVTILPENKKVLTVTSGLFQYSREYTIL